MGLARHASNVLECGHCNRTTRYGATYRFGTGAPCRRADRICTRECRDRCTPDARLSKPAPQDGTCKSGCLPGRNHDPCDRTRCKSLSLLYPVLRAPATGAGHSGRARHGIAEARFTPPQSACGMAHSRPSDLDARDRLGMAPLIPPSAARPASCCRLECRRPSARLDSGNKTPRRLGSGNRRNRELECGPGRTRGMWRRPELHAHFVGTAISGI